MMTLPVFLHIEATPSSSENAALKAYLSQASILIKQYGGVPIATYDVEKAMDERSVPGVINVLSFPSRESIAAFFNDANYLAILPLREKAFSHLRFFITSERI